MLNTSESQKTISRGSLVALVVANLIAIAAMGADDPKALGAAFFAAMIAYALK